VIKSFRSADTERLFNRERVKKFQTIEHAALRRLKMLDATWQLRDLSAGASVSYGKKETLLTSRS
jgi:plasmid maintenance system killer protein